MAVIKCQVSTAGDHQKRIILPISEEERKANKQTSITATSSDNDDNNNGDGSGGGGGNGDNGCNS